MNRRKFIKVFVGAVASISIATQMSPKFPEFKISRMEIEDAGQQMAEALARSMMQTKENVAARVYWDTQTEFLHVEGISREEFYEA